MIVILPLPTYHNVRGPIAKIFRRTDIRFVTLLEDYIVDLTDDSWKRTIHQKIAELEPLLRNGDACVVLTGHPLISLYTIFEILKRTGRVRVLAWDSARRTYIVHTMTLRDLYGEKGN